MHALRTAINVPHLLSAQPVSTQLTQQAPCSIQVVVTPPALLAPTFSVRLMGVAVVIHLVEIVMDLHILNARLVHLIMCYQLL